jgi:hypothetical protein
MMCLILLTFSSMIYFVQVFMVTGQMDARFKLEIAKIN